MNALRGHAAERVARSCGSRRPGGAATDREPLCVLVKAGVALSRAEGGPQNDWSAIAVPPTSAPTMDAPVVRLIDGNRQLDALLGGSDRHRAGRWDAMGKSAKGTIMEWEALPALAKQAWRNRARSRSPSGANRSVGHNRSGTAERLPSRPPRYRRRITILIEILIDTIIGSGSHACLSMHSLPRAPGGPIPPGVLIFRKPPTARQARPFAHGIRRLDSKWYCR